MLLSSNSKCMKKKKDEIHLQHHISRFCSISQNRRHIAGIQISHQERNRCGSVSLTAGFFSGNCCMDFTVVHWSARGQGKINLVLIRIWDFSHQIIISLLATTEANKHGLLILNPVGAFCCQAVTLWQESLPVDVKINWSLKSVGKRFRFYAWTLITLFTAFIMLSISINDKNKDAAIRISKNKLCC